MREKSLAWSERFAFGIDAIDDQHRRLFDYLERLDASLRRGEGWLALRELLDEVAHWADLHFAVEEALLPASVLDGLGDIKRQRRVHRWLRDRIAKA